MKITKVTAKVYEWKGKTEPPRAHFSGSPMDILPLERESMASFRFHGWLVVEVETDDGIIGLGNCAVLILLIPNICGKRCIAPPSPGGERASGWRPCLLWT